MNKRRKNEEKDLEGEIWKDIPNFEGVYQASNKGRIRSLAHTVEVKTKNGSYFRHKEGRILSPHMQNYMRVSLSSCGTSKSYLVHRLVAETFLGAPKDGCEVDHINENKRDNSIENLRWITVFENRSRSTKGRYRRKDAHLSANSTAKYVIGYVDGIQVEKYSCAKELAIKKDINYATLKSRLQKRRCEIDGIEYYYGDFVNKKISPK